MLRLENQLQQHLLAKQLVIQKIFKIMKTLQSIKQRFGIIGNDSGLNRALEKSLRVSATDISVLVTGESGVGKESIPKIIHQNSFYN